MSLHAMSATAVPRRADFGVGKWSRIATYGTKRQQQEDGSWREFLFDDEAFAQSLKNFRRMFSGRGKGMGSDYEHQTLNAPKNGQPAPNLCYFGGMAWVKAGQLRGMEAVQPGVVPIEPEAEQDRIAEQNPASDTDTSGIWVYCTEITPLGERLIPNYSQLSPLFNDNDVDEQGQAVGMAFQNVSFVNVAFQGDTSFNFGKRMTMPQEMAPEMMGKLAKFGYLADKPETLDTAYTGYLESEDSPEERKKLIEAFKAMKAAKMAADPQSGGPGTLPAGAPPAAPPELAAPGQMNKECPPDSDKDGMAKMNKIFETQMAAMTKRLAVAEAAALKAQQAECERTQKEHKAGVAAFKKEMMEGMHARYLPEQEADLDQLIEDVGGDLDKARKHAERLPPVVAFQQFTRGGNPIGQKSVPAPGISAMSRTDKGFAFNKAVKDLRTKEPTLSFADAQKRVYEEQKDLYESAL